MMYFIIFVIYIASIANATPISPNSIIIKPSGNNIITTTSPNLINLINSNLINSPSPTLSLINPTSPTFTLIKPVCPNFNLIKPATPTHIKPLIKPELELVINSNAASDINSNPASEIEPKTVEKSLVTPYSNKLIEEYNRLMRTDEVMHHYKWQVLSEIVKKIMDDKETLKEILKQDDGFGAAYDQHYVRNKKAFLLFSSKYDSFCASLIMGRYH